MSKRYPRALRERHQEKTRTKQAKIVADKLLGRKNLRPEKKMNFTMFKGRQIGTTMYHASCNLLASQPRLGAVISSMEGL